MKRVCYEVKTSRGDFLSELKRPLKRRNRHAVLKRVLFRDAGGSRPIAVDPMVAATVVGASRAFQKHIVHGGSVDHRGSLPDAPSLGT
jgi:hypothetical protein